VVVVVDKLVDDGGDGGGYKMVAEMVAGDGGRRTQSDGEMQMNTGGDDDRWSVIKMKM
jgi:hypothetical protein